MENAFKLTKESFINKWEFDLQMWKRTLESPLSTFGEKQRAAGCVLAINSMLSELKEFELLKEE